MGTPVSPLLLFFFFLSFQGHTVAYGSFQAWGRIRAVAAGLHHSCGISGSEPRRVTYTAAQGNARSPDPLNEARDGTRVLTDTSRIRFCCATTGTPSLSFKG